MKVAAIDIGTNTTRLLIAEPAGGNNLHDIERRLTFTRLGEAVDANSILTRDAMRRTLRAVGEFCATIGEVGAGSLRIAATSAVRDAANRDEFIHAVEKLTGTSVEVLSGSEEARLSFAGATAQLDSRPHLVADIGGGSTELIVGIAGGEPTAAVSMQLGSVRLTERFLRSDPPATEEILLMEGHIDMEIDAVRSGLDVGEGTRFVGVAGTVTTLAAIHLGLEEYDPETTHLIVLPRGAVMELYVALASRTTEQRSQIPCVPEGRAGIIVAGASILARTMARFEFADVVVSEKDILDGLVLEMIGSA